MKVEGGTEAGEGAGEAGEVLRGEEVPQRGQGEGAPARSSPRLWPQLLPPTTRTNTWKEVRRGWSYKALAAETEKKGGGEQCLVGAREQERRCTSGHGLIAEGHWFRGAGSRHTGRFAGSQ